MSKVLTEMGVMAKRESEPKLLKLINKALDKHRFDQMIKAKGIIKKTAMKELDSANKRIKS